MRVEFLESAENDLNTAVDYYELQSAGLGIEFTAEVQRTVRRIQLPNGWQRLSKNTRRCRLKRFPYAVIYQASDELILIVGDMHMRRHPSTWKSRLN